MARQQQKRRRKRYQPGSAYAGDVRPTGVLGFMSSGRMIKIVFIAMALALAAGGFATVFSTDVFTGTARHDNPAGFVVPEDEETDDAGTAQPTVQVKQYEGPPDMVIDASTRYVATIKTELGDIQVELLPDQAPQTVNNFVFLAGDGFYDGLIFHQVAEGFDVQTGDPACTPQTSGTSLCRGDGGPGYDLPQEGTGEFAPGTLGMVNGSQFFIALTDSEQFASFTPFGRVVSGLDVAQQLTPGTEIQDVEVEEL